MRTKKTTSHRAKPTLHAKEVEILVEKLESLLHDGAEIRRNELLPSQGGGDREVDVTVRVTVGGSRLLIALECRGRRRLEDVMWIEQLVTKRGNIRATHMIAVSSRGFSKKAQSLANQRGIELRTLEQLSADDFQRWLPGFRMEFTRMVVDVLSVQVVHQEQWPDGLLGDVCYDDRVLTRPGDQILFSVYDLIEQAKSRPSAAVVVGDDAPLPDRAETMVFEGPFDAAISGQTWRVDQLIAEVKLSTTSTPMPVLWSQRYQNVGADTPQVARAVLNTDAVPEMTTAAVSLVPGQRTLTVEIGHASPGRATPPEE